MSGVDTGADAAADARALASARWIVGALVAGALLLTALGSLVQRDAALHGLVLPAAIAGAASPVIGFRLYRIAADAEPLEESHDDRRRAFLRAHVVAASVTEAAAVFGAVVHAVSADPLALIGVLMHVLLAGALWPTEERLAAFHERATGLREG